LNRCGWDSFDLRQIIWDDSPPVQGLTKAIKAFWTVDTGNGVLEQEQGLGRWNASDVDTTSVKVAAGRHIVGGLRRYRTKRRKRVILLQGNMYGPVAR
jgi:hypothetical protein